MTAPAVIDDRVRAVVSGVVRHDASAVGRDADLVEAFGIDSLQGLQILASVEKQCGVRLPDDELVEMRTIGRIADAVERLERGGSS